MPGAEVVNGNHHAHVAQLGEQLLGNGTGFYQFAFRQLQYQAYLAGGKGAEKVAAVVQQFEVLAMSGGDIHPHVEAGLKGRRLRGEQGGSLLQQ